MIHLINVSEKHQHITSEKGHAFKAKRKQSQLFREKYESTEINEPGFIFKRSLKDHS